MVGTLNPPKKSLVGGGWVVRGWVGGRPNLVYSPGPGLWSLALGPFGPDLGPALDLTWDLDLDLSLTIVNFSQIWPKNTYKNYQQQQQQQQSFNINCLVKNT